MGNTTSKRKDIIRTRLYAAEVRLVFAKIFDSELGEMLDINILENIGKKYLDNNALNLVPLAEEEWNEWKNKYHLEAPDLNEKIGEVDFKVSMLREGITFHIITSNYEEGPPRKEYLFTITEILFNSEEDKAEREHLARRDDIKAPNEFIIRCEGKITAPPRPISNRPVPSHGPPTIKFIYTAPFKARPSYKLQPGWHIDTYRLFNFAHTFRIHK